MKAIFPKKFITAALMALASANAGLADDQPSKTVMSLQAGFQQPPPEARPAVLWDWMGGMLSKAGITKDLEALKSWSPLKGRRVHYGLSVIGSRDAARFERQTGTLKRDAPDAVYPSEIETLKNQASRLQMIGNCNTKEP